MTYIKIDENTIEETVEHVHRIDKSELEKEKDNYVSEIAKIDNILKEFD